MSRLIEIENFLHENNVLTTVRVKVNGDFKTSLDDDKHTIIAKNFNGLNVVIVKIKFSDFNSWYYDSSYTQAYIEVNTKEEAEVLEKELIEFYA